MLGPLDQRLLRVLRTRGHGPAAERAILAYSRTGEHAALWYTTIALAAALDARHRRFYGRVAATVFATQVLNSMIKLSLNRARPLLEDLPALSPVMSDLSLPSAHASTSFAAATALSRQLPAPPLFAAAVLMALSRPYLGVHYPSDVVAGAALGAATGWTAR